MRRLVLSLLLAGALAGCGGSDVEVLSGNNGGAPNAAGIVAIQSASLDDQTGGNVIAGTGHALRVPGGALTEDTLATVTVFAEPPRQPADSDFQSVGQYMEIDLGSADLVEEIEIEIPYQATRPDSTYAQLIVGDLVVPLQTEPISSQTSQSETVVKARFNPALIQNVGGFDSSNFVVGVAESTGYEGRVPHVDWPSWNAYIYEDGAFQPFVRQGVKLPVVFEPGSKPVVVVHGFGSNASRFGTVAQALKNDGYSSVIAFEYDTLAPVEVSGENLREFYDMVTEGVPNLEWHHLAHSMGVLVSRESFESHGDSAYPRNYVVFAGGANLGSPVVDTLIAKPTFFETGMNYLLSNNLLDFQNSDGTPCKVDIDDRGFRDLSSTSSIVVELMNNPGLHPQENYRTVAGTSQGPFALANALLGTRPRPEDGVITQASANANFIGAKESTTIAFDHVAMLDNTTVAIPKILELLARIDP